jgi:hypothetical protein
MNRITRTVLATAFLGSAVAAAASAQNIGMPLFSNPRYGSGIRLHLDAGRPSEDLQNADVTTVQGGVSFALGAVGISAYVAGNITDLNTVSTGCGGTNAIACSQTYFSGAALANLRLYGGGTNPAAISVFGGVGTDFSSLELGGVIGSVPKQLTIPVGAALGYHLGPLVIWGAPRYNLYKLTSCDEAVLGAGACETTNDFRYAVGVSIPLGPLGIRAAYDGGKLNGVDRNFIGVGVSLGLGSQQ